MGLTDFCGAANKDFSLDCEAKDLTVSTDGTNKVNFNLVIKTKGDSVYSKVKCSYIVLPS